MTIEPCIRAGKKTGSNTGGSIDAVNIYVYRPGIRK
jgi:hypothetical protein